MDKPQPNIKHSYDKYNKWDDLKSHNITSLEIISEYQWCIIEPEEGYLKLEREDTHIEDNKVYDFLSVDSVLILLPRIIIDPVHEDHPETHQEGEEVYNKSHW